jgi:hypothetical protein
MQRRILLATVLLLIGFAQRPAEAFWGCGGYGTNYYGYGLPAGWYTGVNDRVPPYFALHPPVYYSGQIVRIPYGASPFANGPFMAGPFAATPAAFSAAPAAAAAHARSEPVASETIENPFFTGEAPDEGALPPPHGNAAPNAEAVPTDDQQGIMILNPYFRRGAQVAQRP